MFIPTFYLASGVEVKVFKSNYTHCVATEWKIEIATTDLDSYLWTSCFLWLACVV